jgi:hypothetical protein
MTEHGTWERERVETPERAWQTADHLAREAYRLGQSGDLAATDTMIESIRYELRAIALIFREAN